MTRYYYSSSISRFLQSAPNEILGTISQASEFSDEFTQKNAWLQQIDILKQTLQGWEGFVYFEYSIPRMGRRIDVLLIIKHAIFILEFKVGESEFLNSAIDQVFDYALDLKNFHETSHHHLIAPILIASKGAHYINSISTTAHGDNILYPLKANSENLRLLIEQVLDFITGEHINVAEWIAGRYQPTPTIIEAAMALYNNHSVAEISRSDASAVNLSQTSNAVSEVIDYAKLHHKKAICFVTGVPGAGKTLVGLDVATKHLDKDAGTSSVFLSGNGPLVAILREALTRDRVKRLKEEGKKITKIDAGREVKMFIQNVHHFRDEYLKDDGAPFDHVAIFDEAQRAWNHEQTVSFMRRKKNVLNFSVSEPEYLISCLDRHKDWAVIVCLVGGGQEINVGEAGISEWINSLNRSFPNWEIHMSSRLTDSEYDAGKALQHVLHKENLFIKDELHLSVSMRSFRAEHVSSLIKNMLDLDIEAAKKDYNSIKEKYPIVLTRDLEKAKIWLRQKARGTERYGIVVSSQAQRLKPLAIDVKSPMDPIHWFLDGKEDVRSSYYLEDVATEFQVQGLELDWACVTWDADFRYSPESWRSHSFVGAKWNNIVKAERKLYLKNAYRVLLTRARQGMVIVIPSGNDGDPTRHPSFYDKTYAYLKSVGFETL